jgi:hypothetical protein
VGEFTQSLECVVQGGQQPCYNVAITVGILYDQLAPERQLLLTILAQKMSEFRFRNYVFHTQFRYSRRTNKMKNISNFWEQFSTLVNLVSGVKTRHVCAYCIQRC